MEVKLQEYLNSRAKIYLNLIIKEFGNLPIKDENGRVISSAEELNLSDMIVVHKDDFHLQEQYKKDGNVMNTPLAHGGRVFNDGKIHFYPCILNVSSFEDIAYQCESILIHELFHYFIRPQYINEENFPELAGVTNFIGEGLVDMYALDFMKRYNLFQKDESENRRKYNSEYARNVLYVRDLLNSTISNLELRNKIVFNAGIEDFLNMSPYAKEFYTTYCRKEEGQEKKSISIRTPFEMYVWDMIRNNFSEYDLSKQEGMYRSAINEGARCINSAHAKEYVSEQIKLFLQSNKKDDSKPKIRVRTLPENNNNGYISIVGILIIIVLISLVVMYLK